MSAFPLLPFGFLLPPSFWIWHHPSILFMHRPPLPSPSTSSFPATHIPARPFFIFSLSSTALSSTSSHSRDLAASPPASACLNLDIPSLAHHNLPNTQAVARQRILTLPLEEQFVICHARSPCLIKLLPAPVPSLGRANESPTCRPGKILKSYKTYTGSLPPHLRLLVRLRLLFIWLLS